MPYILIADFAYYIIELTCALGGSVYITNSPPNWPLKFGAVPTSQHVSHLSLLFKLCLRVEFELSSVLPVSYLDLTNLVFK